jgi:hypothetical protein
VGVHLKKKTQKKKSGGGLFHALLHNPISDVAVQTARDFGKFAESAPGGVVQTGRDAYLDVAHPRPGTSGIEAITHPIRGIQRTRQYQDIIKPGAI